MLAAVIMLFISALPDAMVVPVLRQLMVDRYGVSVGAAHAFMTVNVIGALAGVCLLKSIRKNGSIGRKIAAASALNAILLAAMALPIGFIPTLMLRCIEGVVDIVVYAFILDFVAECGRQETKGRRMGGAATCLMLGIASGIGIGGLVGNISPTLTLWVGALTCLVVVPISFQTFNRFEKLPERPSNQTNTVKSKIGIYPLWPSLAMMLTDRALAGVLTVTVPLYFAGIVELSPGSIGGLIGIGMLMTALGAWPAGYLVDKTGPLRIRIIAGALFAGGFALIPQAVSVNTNVACLVMILVGLGGAALFASSLTMVVGSGRGPSGMAAYHLAGNVGFLLGPLFAGASISILGGTEPDATSYVLVLVAFASIHGAITLGTVLITQVLCRETVSVTTGRDEIASPPIAT